MSFGAPRRSFRTSSFAAHSWGVMSVLSRRWATPSGRLSITAANEIGSTLPNSLANSAWWSLNPSALLYIDEHPEDISLVADSEKFCRPDVVLDVTQIDDWAAESAAEYLQKVRLWHTALKPAWVLHYGPQPRAARTGCRCGGARCARNEAGIRVVPLGAAGRSHESGSRLLIQEGRYGTQHRCFHQTGHQP